MFWASKEAGVERDVELFEPEDELELDRHKNNWVGFWLLALLALLLLFGYLFTVVFKLNWFGLLDFLSETGFRRDKWYVAEKSSPISKLHASKFWLFADLRLRPVVELKYFPSFDFHVAVRLPFSLVSGDCCCCFPDFLNA